MRHKNIRICVDGAFHDSVNLQIRPESFRFFFSFLSYSEVLICIRKPNSRKDSIKGRFYDGVILLYQISSRFCFLGFYISVGLTNLNMKEKMKGIPLLAKKSHRVKRQLDPVAQVALQQFRRDPYGSQFLCFRARFQTLFVHCFPNP